MKKVNKFVVLGLISAGLTGCASDGYLAKQFGYTSDKYIPIDKADKYFAQQKIKASKVEYNVEKIPVSRSAVITSYGLSQNPEIKKAYENYVSGGQETVVRSDGFITYPFDTYSRPILECSIGRVCAIQLEAGEKITTKGVLAGDTVRWKVSIQKTGDGADESQMVSIKPIVPDNRDPNVKKSLEIKKFSTNLMITTNKRVYNIGLLAQPKGAISTVMNFYYPLETAKDVNKQIEQLAAQNKTVAATPASLATDVNFNDINTNYSIDLDTKSSFFSSKKATNPSWMPLQVFDDGHKTFIKLPKNADQFQLPAVWVVRDDNKEELSNNATYQSPYYVVDGVYKKVLLFTGFDNKKVQVTITRD